MRYVCRLVIFTTHEFTQFFKIIAYNIFITPGTLRPGEDRKSAIREFKQKLSSSNAKQEAEDRDSLESLLEVAADAKKIFDKAEADIRASWADWTSRGGASYDRVAARYENFERWYKRKTTQVESLWKQAVQKRLQADQSCKGNSTSAYLRGSIYVILLFETILLL